MSFTNVAATPANADAANGPDEPRPGPVKHLADGRSPADATGTEPGHRARRVGSQELPSAPTAWFCP